MLALWLALTGLQAGADALIGALAAAVAAAGWTLVGRRDEVAYVVRPGHLALLVWRLPPRVVAESATVLRALARHLAGRPVHGRTRWQPFDPGKPDDPRDAARRALAIAAVSTAPNSVVVRLDERRSALLLHELVPRSGSEPADREWPL